MVHVASALCRARGMYLALTRHLGVHVARPYPDSAQAEYEREAIDWSYIQFVDNQDVLDLIERRPLGILDVLDEQCRFPRARAWGQGRVRVR